MKPLLLALALAAPAFGADAATPSGAAVRFVEKLRSRDLDLSPGKDTALSPATGPDKRKLIAERIQVLARELGQAPAGGTERKPFGDVVEAGAQKVDDDMAAVLVHQATGFDPGRLRVIAIGLLRRNGDWFPAPVPGSFENTALGYDESRNKRLADLEAWMLREQVAELTTLREQSSERLRKAIEGSLPKEEIRHSTPDQMAKRFLAACAARDQPSLLGLLGGLQGELPNDWSTRVAAADLAFAADPAPGPWHYLIGPGVIRTILNSNAAGNEATVNLLCLDASGEVGKPMLPQMHRLKLDLQKDSGGVWRVDLPTAFTQPETKNGKGDEGDESDLELAKMPGVVKAWQRDHPSAPAASAEAARDALLKALTASEPDGLIPLVDLEGDTETAILGVIRLAQVWRDLHNPRDVRTPLPIAFHEDREQGGAVAAVQIFWSRLPTQEDVRKFFFVKGAAGWQLATGLRPDNPPQPALAESKAWADEQTADWKAQWTDLALAASPALDAVPSGEAPPEDAVRSAFQTWSGAIARGDIATTIGLTAYFRRDKAAGHLLQNLGAELTGSKKTGRKATILGILRRGPWAAVSARIGPAGDDETVYPLYPLLSTPAGPRVLAGVDLFANGGHTRDFLNEVTFKRLQAAGENDAAASLMEIYEIHRKNAEADRPPVPDK